MIAAGILVCVFSSMSGKGLPLAAAAACADAHPLGDLMIFSERPPVALDHLVQAVMVASHNGKDIVKAEPTQVSPKDPKQKTPDSTYALKRKRNNEAVRRCRSRKKALEAEKEAVLLALRTGNEL